MNNNTFVHKYLKGLINKEDTVVDMTVGNGNDTYYLCENAKKVIGFDIQEIAIQHTKDRCKDFHNLELYNDNFINVNQYIQEKVKLFIFNLGYLPHGNEEIITKAEDSLLAIKKAYDLLLQGGYLVISFYIGHKGGKDEYYAIDQYMKDKNWIILESYQQDKKYKQPLTYIIKKQ